MSKPIDASPKWLWWLVFAIYSYFCIVSFLEYAFALSAWAIPRSLLLLTPVALFGFVRQIRILRREVWVIYFLLGCAFAAYGLVGMLLPVFEQSEHALVASTAMLPMLVAWVLMWSLPVLFALWAYAFRSPHIWNLTPTLVA